MHKTEVIMDQLAGALITYKQMQLTERNKSRAWQGALMKIGENSYEQHQRIVEITKAESINMLSKELKDLVILFLPVFFKYYPEYKDAECLKIKE